MFAGYPGFNGIGHAGRRPREASRRLVVNYSSISYRPTRKDKQLEIDGEMHWAAALWDLGYQVGVHWILSGHLVFGLFVCLFAVFIGSLRSLTTEPPSYSRCEAARFNKENENFLLGPDTRRGDTGTFHIEETENGVNATENLKVFSAPSSGMAGDCSLEGRGAGLPEVKSLRNNCFGFIGRFVCSS